MTSQLMDSLHEHARRRPDSPAIVEVVESGPGRSLTWSGLFNCVSVAAENFRAMPARDGVVLVSLPGRMELPIAILGALLADAWVLPVSANLTATELRAVAQESRAALFVGSASAREMLGDQAPPWLSPDDLAKPGGWGPNPDALSRHRGRAALLLQTSGTTGMPKIARRDMPALDAVAANCVAALGLDAADHMLLTLPLHHSYGLEHGILSCVRAGCTLELHTRFEPFWVGKALAHGQVTHMPGVPFIFDMLARTLATRCHRAVRQVYSAGSPLPASVAGAFEDVTGVSLGQIYGATEYGSVTFHHPQHGRADGLSAGLPMNGVGLRVLDPADPRVDQPLAAGQEGRLAVAAPSMFTSYLGDASPSTQGGWFITGDLARIDSQGRLHITGRLSLLIDVGGIKVNPFEVEAVLARHPDVREVVVVPIPVTPTLNRIKAVVLLRDNAKADVEELRRFAQIHLSGHKVPRVFEIRSSLPRTPGGKVLRQVLQCS